MDEIDAESKMEEDSQESLGQFTLTELCLPTENLLYAPRINLESAGARSFQHQVPSVWNSLPIQIRLSTSAVFQV